MSWAISCSLLVLVCCILILHIRGHPILVNLLKRVGGGQGTMSSENCEICAKKPKLGKYMKCPGVAQHKFCYPCWDAMAYKRFFVSGDVYCPVGQSCLNIYGEEMPWTCKESEMRGLRLVAKVQLDVLKREKLQKLKDKKGKKEEKNVRTVVQSENIAGHKDEDLETVLKKFSEDSANKEGKQKNSKKSFKEKQLKGAEEVKEALKTMKTEKQKFSEVKRCQEAQSNNHDKQVEKFLETKDRMDGRENVEVKKTKGETIKLLNKGQEETNRTTGARPKVKFTNSNDSPPDSLSQSIDGRRNKLSIDFETVTATTPCENHVIEQLTRAAIKTFEFIGRNKPQLCQNCQTLWCKNCIMKCGGCMKAMYCNEVCQAADWENHRPLCMEESEEED